MKNQLELSPRKLPITEKEGEKILFGNSKDGIISRTVIEANEKAVKVTVKISEQTKINVWFERKTGKIS